MPNDILKVSDKRVLIAGPITSYSYEIGYTYTSQGASICFLTPDTDKARRVCDTLNESRELYRNYGRALFYELDLRLETIDRTIDSALQSIFGLDIYIDALNLFAPESIAKELPGAILEKISSVLTERLRGRIVILVDQSLQHIEHYQAYSEFRQKSIDWFESQKNQLLQKNIIAHHVVIPLSEDSLLFINPQKTINESLKVLNEKTSLTLKITKPDNISKILIAATSDLTSSLAPTLFRTQ